MHISDLKAYSDSSPPFIDDRQIEQSYGHRYRRPQNRTKPELLELAAERQSPDTFKGTIIDIYV